MGCMGMSLVDFDACTPGEFRAIADSWNRNKEYMERGMWERMRYECLCMLQPYSKKQLSVVDVLSLPWDKATTESPKENLNREEIKKRFAEAKRRYGLK